MIFSSLRNLYAGAKAAGVGRPSMGFLTGVGIAVPAMTAATGISKMIYSYPDFPRQGMTSGFRGLDAPMGLSAKIMTLQGRGSRVRRMIR